MNHIVKYLNKKTEYKLLVSVRLKTPACDNVLFLHGLCFDCDHMHADVIEREA